MVLSPAINIDRFIWELGWGSVADLVGGDLGVSWNPSFGQVAKIFKIATPISSTVDTLY